MNALLELASQGHLPGSRVEELGLKLGLLPDRGRWLRMLDRSLLAAAALLIASGLIFFIAANWGALDRYGKLALAQLAIICGVGMYWHYGDVRLGRAALGFAVLSLGALLALYGQTYQTGADAYQLFAAWAALSLVWVWLVAHPALWLGWLVLVDIGLLRWLGYQPGLWGGASEFEWVCASMLLVHAGALLLAEYLATRGWQVAAPRYPRHILYLVALSTLSLLAMGALLDSSAKLPALMGVLYLVGLALSWYAYRVRRVELVPLSMACLSIIVLTTTLIVKAIGFNHDGLGLFFVATVVVVGLTGAAGTWLLQVQRSTRSDS